MTSHIGCYFAGEIQHLQIHLIEISIMPYTHVMTELFSVGCSKNFVRKLILIHFLTVQHLYPGRDSDIFWVPKLQISSKSMISREID